MVNHYITLNQKTTGSVHALYAVKIFFVVLFETTTATKRPTSMFRREHEHIADHFSVSLPALESRQCNLGF